MKPLRSALAAACLVAALPAFATDERAMTEAARQTAISMQKNLAGKLLAQIDKGGPASAIGVCATIAPEVASELSRQSGWRVTRVSLKVRNPVLGTPDAWEQQVLREFDERAARGEKPESLEHTETVTEPQGRVFRYMKALPVQETCLTCHGDADKQSPELKARLATYYPKDQATGYQVGQIRGALTVKRPLP